MSREPIEPGCSFQFAGRFKDDHLWFVVSDCRSNPGEVLILNVSTWREWSDPSCILNAGDHSFVSHKSCIRYDMAATIGLDRLYAMLDAGLIILHGYAGRELMDKILDGAAQSDRLAMDYKKLLSEQGLIL
jgi:hypothetical protein